MKNQFNSFVFSVYVSVFIFGETRLLIYIRKICEKPRESEILGKVILTYMSIFKS